MEEVKNYQIDRKYRITFEQAASAKGILGFKVEVNGDDKSLVEIQAVELLEFAKSHAPQIGMEAK